MTEILDLSRERSPSTGRLYGLARVARVFDVPRSSVYDYLKRSKENTRKQRRGRRPELSDEMLLGILRDEISESGSVAFGYGSIWARVRAKYGVKVSRQRVLRLLREHGLSPQSGPSDGQTSICRTSYLTLSTSGIV